MKRSLLRSAPLAVAAALLLLPQVARAAGHGELTRHQQGSLRYRWTRGALAFELHDRAGHWTAEEAGWVAEALDSLPDVYLRRARVGAGKMYRDGKKPNAPWEVLQEVGDKIAGIAAPIAPWHYIAFGDRTFRDRDKAIRVTVHELGHCVQFALSGLATVVTGTRGFTSINWTTGVPGIGLKSYNGFPSNYARNNHMEDFAEACEFYWVAPSALRKASRAKYEFMRDVVFQGNRSPSSVRVEQEPTALVRPEISSLGDSHDSWYSLVKVRGQYFMGPLDGGYNRVHYRGTRAVHVPVSRGLIYSWVPSIKKGSAPITVTTQDGTSEGKAFRVDHPWWKFW